jgi:hypothetical protein
MDRENIMLEFAENDEQFVISYELLCLLRWLIEHDADKFKKMISRAVMRGLKHRIQHISTFSDEEALEDAHENMIEFFSTLESMLIETIQEQSDQNTIRKHMIPAIERLDSSSCDDTLVQSSLEKTQNKIINNHHENPQDVLLKEILKHWKPNKNQSVH